MEVDRSWIMNNNNFFQDLICPEFQKCFFTHQRISIQNKYHTSHDKNILKKKTFMKVRLQ